MFIKFILILLVPLFARAAAVTYDFSGGRFGDNLLAYLHAKWLSFKYEIPLLYKPFAYSSELTMHANEKHYFLYKKNYKRVLQLNQKITKPNPNRTIIYSCPYFPEIPWELRSGHYFTFQPDWKNRLFRQEALAMITPLQPIRTIYPPADAVSIAMHIRDGGAFDDYEHHFKHPLKTPPISYYIESIHRVLSLFENNYIYCHVFTDALDPQKLIQPIIDSIPEGRKVSFDYRKDDNRDDCNVLEDFFSLFNFDILIRAASNYSIVPALLHDYAVVIYPETFTVLGTFVSIDTIKVDIDECLYENCLKKSLL